MSSVTNTFRNLLPLWTSNVRPTNSGTIVQRRAQVLIGSCEPRCTAICTLRYSLGSTNGPFFKLRPMSQPRLVMQAQAHKHTWHGALPVPQNYFLPRSFTSPYRRL